jgi:methionine synthase II (cobalamin-independent)
MEYPPLELVTKDILRVGNWNTRNETRRDLAASLRESLKKAEESGVPLITLRAIAMNLHNPPPPAPTLAEAREAARQLGGPSADIVHRFLDTLQGAE